MTTITVRLNEEESELFNSYAEVQDMPLSTIFKEALKDKLEDELDIAYIKELEKTVDEDSELYTHEEVKNILGIK